MRELVTACVLLVVTMGATGLALAVQPQLRRQSVVLMPIVLGAVCLGLAVYPHTKHLADMRRAGGFVSGRRAMAKHSGAVQPKAAQLRVAETGWQRLLEAVAGAVSDGLVLLPGSRSPQMTLCPGYGLLEELSVIAHAGVSTERTLELATVQAAFTLAVELPPAGEAAVSAPSEPKGFLSLRPSFSNI